MTRNAGYRATVAVTRATLHIGNVGCPCCMDAIRDGLAAVEGVLEATLEHDDAGERGVARVRYLADRVRPEELVALVIRLGADRRQRYEASLVEVSTAA